MALTKLDDIVIDDWTAVAQTADDSVVVSSEYDASGNYETILNIQAFLDSTTAHTGTEFTVQYSTSSTGDENWIGLVSFVALVGTAATFVVTTEASSGQKVIISTTLPAGFDQEDAEHLVVGVEDTVLANSELVTVKGYTLNTSITCVDNLTNTHAVTTTNCYNIAFTRAVSIPFPVERIRLMINNDYDSDGSTLNYRFSANGVTGL